MKDLYLLLDRRFYAIVFQSYWFLHRDQYIAISSFLPANRKAQKLLHKCTQEVQALVRDYCRLIDFYGIHSTYLDPADIPKYLVPVYRYGASLNVTHMQALLRTLEECEEHANKLILKNITHTFYYRTERIALHKRLVEAITMRVTTLTSNLQFSRALTRLQRVQTGIAYLKKTSEDSS